MSSPLDVELQDDEQLDEIRLLGELMVLASESQGALDLTTIDAGLGVRRPALPGQRLVG
jgi:hypothetical protein